MANVLKILTGFLFLSFFTASAVLADPFAPKVDYGANEKPQAIATGDLDGDGDQDLITANMGGNTISVLKNNGDGSFSEKVDYATGEWPRSVIAADLDGDGDLDLAVAEAGEPAGSRNAISILMNNVDGTFGTRTTYEVGLHPTSLSVADMDGDGDLDLAVANRFGPGGTILDNVSVLQNNGDGTFAPKVDYEVGDSPHSLSAADFDGDGDVDLAVANYGESGAGNNVSVLKNNGDGTFAPKMDYPTGRNSYSLFAADLDLDGDLDLAVANASSNTISVLRNIGDGTFEAKADYPTNVNPASVFAAHLDSDGLLDLAVANSGLGSGNTISVLHNNGDGTFAAKVDYPTAQEPRAVVASDLDGDGDKDLATANWSGDNISVLKNLASACIAARGDMNCDGNLTPADAVVMLNCVFLVNGNCDLSFSDTNCDGGLTAADAVLELNAVFLGAPFPC